MDNKDMSVMPVNSFEQVRDFKLSECVSSGLTKREHVIIELAKALLTHGGTASYDSDGLAQDACAYADILLEKMEE